MGEKEIIYFQNSSEWETKEFWCTFSFFMILFYVSVK